MSGWHAPPDHAVTLGSEGAREVLARSPESRGGAALSSRFPPGEYGPPPGRHVLALRRGGPRRRVWREDGRTTERVVGDDDVGLVPAGKPFTFEVQQTIETLSVVLREDFVGRIAERAGLDYGRVEVLGGVSAGDPLLANLVLSFLPEVGGGGLGGELYAEALTTQLAVHLLRHHSSLGRRRKLELVRPPAGPAPRRAVSRALDYIGDNLSGALSLEELAQAAGYSPNHFAKLFGEATGLPPHRYVVGERVKRARSLLGGTELPLAEVARMCGFSSQSHMGRAVKAATGATPGRLRREARR